MALGFRGSQRESIFLSLWLLEATHSPWLVTVFRSLKSILFHALIILLLSHLPPSSSAAFLPCARTLGITLIPFSDSG